MTDVVASIVFAAGIIGGPLYVLFVWQPCICRYLRPGENCPRHGEVLDGRK